MLPSDQQFLCLLTVRSALSSSGQVATLHHASVSLFHVTGGNADLPRGGRMRGQQFVSLWLSLPQGLLLPGVGFETKVGGNVLLTLN